MVGSTIVRGTRVVLRLVKSNDAPFIVSLRNDPKNNTHLSSQRYLTIKEQRAWLVTEKMDETSLYFIILFQNEKVGTISLYNISENLSKAELGRFICSNSIYAIDAELTLLEYAFNTLGLQQVLCRTKTTNKSVLSLHRNLFFEDSTVERVNNYEIMWQSLEMEKYKISDYSSIKYILKSI